MKLLRNRGFAVAVMVVFIIGSILGGGCRSLQKLSDDVQDLYHTGTDGLGDVSEYMSVCETCTGQLVELGNQYLGKDAAVCQTAEILLHQSETSGQPAEQYTANQKLIKSAEALYTQLKAEPNLDATDLEKVERLYAEIAGNGDRVERISMQRRDAYNDAAERFNKGPLRAFPGGLLANLLGVEKLDPIY